MTETLRLYYYLTKPGIIWGNIIATVAGFLLAARGNISFIHFLGTLLGLALVIGSACVFNNYIDRDIDKKMKRTQKRSLVTKRISVRNALIYGTVLGIFGFINLYLFSNLLTTFIAFVGFIFYVIIYGIGKRKTEYGTIIGSISGAVPPVVGYTAVTDRFDFGALLLFLILVFWQMPHFYAIALYRQKDYEEAGIPVLPIKRGKQTTKIHILVYIVGLFIVSSLLSFYKYAGLTYFIVTLIVCGYWLYYGLNGFKTENTEKWAKKMFFISLIVLLSLCMVMCINVALP